MPLTPKAAQQLADMAAAAAKKKGKGKAAPPASDAPIPRPGGKGGFQPPMMRDTK